MFARLLSHVQEQTNATATRSDVLKPLIWPIGLLLTTSVGLAAAKSPVWLILTPLSLCVVLLIIYAVAFVGCLLKNPDLLRSESYGLKKMAIERGLYGDDRIGLQEAALPAIEQTPTTSSSADNRE